MRYLLGIAVVILSVFLVILGFDKLKQDNLILLGAGTEYVTILNAVAATSTGATFNATPYRNIIISVSATSSPTATIKVLGSAETGEPAFGSAQTFTNVWDYIEIVDLQNGNTIDGDTGVSFTGSADTRLFEVNTNGLRWVTVNLTSYTAGTTTVKIRGFDNL